MNPSTAKDERITFFTALASQYLQLSNGDKAALRKVVLPDDLLMQPAFYHLLQATLEQFKEQTKTQMRKFLEQPSLVVRFVYLLPYFQCSNNQKSLGALFREHGLSERRLFLVMRSDYPQDLVQLRRLCQQIKGTPIDTGKLGELLFYWGRDSAGSEGSKRQLMQQYYLSSGADKTVESLDVEPVQVTEPS